MKISILGAGSMGCAVARHLSFTKNKIILYTPFKSEAEILNKDRENIEKLPGIKLNENVSITYNSKDLMNSDMFVIAIPSQFIRETLKKLKNIFHGKENFICVSKGIEKNTGILLYDIIYEVTLSKDICILTGPSHAEELGKEIPTVMVAASFNKSLAKKVQNLFMTDNLRIYTSEDVIGVEIAGALKNVIALCAGVSDGLGYGDNTKAALMTRGITEITRLGIKMGAKKETFSGLAGIGDLIVTCTSMHSRNRRAGMYIGQGLEIESAISKVGMVVEGYYTTKAAYNLSKKYNVKLPIIESLYNILFNNLSPEKAVKELMTRDKKDEF